MAANVKTHKVSAEDKMKALELVKDLQSKVADVTNHIRGLQSKVVSRELNTAKGVSFLEVKYQMLLSYLIDMTQILLCKVRGQSIEGNPSIERLVEIRTVLEKMKPIDQKLKYQIDKLVTTAKTGVLGKNDPLRFKPNPDNLQSKFDDGGSSDEEKPETSKAYKPPKLSAVHYDGDETVQEFNEKQMKQAQKRALNSSVMRDLKAEYYEGPEEIRESADLHRTKEDKAGKERTDYEEKYFVRMNVSKQEMNAAKKMRTLGGLNDLTKFGDFSAITDGPMDEQPRKKRKTASFKSKKGSKASKKWKRKK